MGLLVLGLLLGAWLWLVGTNPSRELLDIQDEFVGWIAAVAALLIVAHHVGFQSSATFTSASSSRSSIVTPMPSFTGTIERPK